MDLIFQVPMQYWYLQHQTLLSPPDTSTAGHSFRFDSLLIYLFYFSSYFSTLSQEHIGNLQTWKAQGFPVPLLDPQTEKSNVESRSFATVCELFWYDCSLACGSLTQQLCGKLQDLWWG